MSGPKSLIGQPAPAVTATSANGEQFELDPATAGRPTVIFFFPAAGTYGCTKEVCSFRDAFSSNELYKTLNVQLIGISGDEVSKQKAFVDAQNIPFTMLCDTDGEARKKYQVGKAMLGLTEGNAHEKAVTKWLATLPKPGPAGEPDAPLDDAPEGTGA